MENTIGKRITVFSVAWRLLLPLGSQICLAFTEGHCKVFLDFLRLDFQAFDSIYYLFDM